MNQIIAWSVESKYWALFLTLALLVAGAIAFKYLPVDAVPDITNVQVVISTEVPGLVPEEIERNVTFLVEVGMQGIAGVTQIRSVTRFGLSQVTITFKDGTDLFKARQLAAERLSGITLANPDWKPQLGPISTGLGEIFHFALDFENPAQDRETRIKQLQELRAIQDWWLKPRLLSIPGIAEVNTIGGFEKEFHILPNQEKMSQYGVSFADIEHALSQVNRNVGGSYIQQSSEQFLVQGKGLFTSIEDIERVPVRSLETLRTLRIGDVANVKVGEEIRRGAALFNGRETVIGTVIMLLGENSRIVAERVSKAVVDLNQQLPKGIQIVPVYDRSILVDATLTTVEKNLALGGLLVLVILLALLGNFRAALITAFIIPCSLLGTFIGMKFFGFSGNLMSLGALDFGIIVDGAVIVIDNIVRSIHDKSAAFKRSLTRFELDETIITATIEIRKAAGFGQLIIVMIFLPIMMLDGVAGKMFRPMAATFSICLFVALLLSFTTVPALAAILMQPNAEDKEPKMMEWVRIGYQGVQDFFLHHAKMTMGFGLASFVLGAYLMTRLGGEFIPQLDEGTVALEIIRPVNISLDHGIELQKKTDEVLLSFPEVKWAFSRMGTAKVVTDPQGMNQTDTFVEFHPKEKWRKKLKADGSESFSRISKEELKLMIKEKLDHLVPGQRVVISQPIQMRFNELLEGNRADVSLKVFGTDMKTLVETADKVRDIVSTVPGVGDVGLDLTGTSELLTVETRKSAVERLALSPNEILQAVEVGIGGREIGQMFENERRFPIVLRLDDQTRRDMDTLKTIPVSIGQNAVQPLDQVAHLDFTDTYGLISRENGMRRTTVLINPRGRDTESFVNEAQSVVKNNVQLPFGYSLEWGGDFKKLQDTKVTLSIMTPLILLAVFMMVYAAFRNFVQAAVVFACVPLSLVGGVLALMMKGLPFSISAGVGFIALSGIAVLNGVVLVSFFNELRMKGERGWELVKKGTLIRLRPVLMTALVDVFGFLPMMFASGMGSEIQQPLAAVVVGGIISATLLTLIVLPTIYYWLDLKFPKSMDTKKPTKRRSEIFEAPKVEVHGLRELHE